MLQKVSHKKFAFLRRLRINIRKFECPNVVANRFKGPKTSSNMYLKVKNHLVIFKTKKKIWDIEISIFIKIITIDCKLIGTYPNQLLVSAALIKFL